MEKYSIILVGFLLLSLAGAAQTVDSPVVIIASGGKVDYVSGDKSVKMRVIPGAVLKKSGKLTLAKKASAVVYCDGRIQQLEGKATFAFTDVFPEGGVSPLNFDPRFGRYIRMAVELTAIKSGSDGWGKRVGDGWGHSVTDTIRSTDGWGRGVTDTIRSADGWGRGVTDTIRSTDGWGRGVTDTIRTADGWGRGVTDTIRSTDGWGGHGFRIIPILPVGKVLPGVVVFSWSRPAGASAYQVIIQDAKKQRLHSVTVQDTFVPIDLRALNLASGNPYYWRVQAPDAPRITSTLVEFTVSSADEQASDLKRAAKSNVYNKGEADLKGLMEAAALEEYEWYYDAQQKYAALFKRYPKNTMLRMLYSAYWMRAGVAPMARKVMNDE